MKRKTVNVIMLLGIFVLALSFSACSQPLALSYNSGAAALSMQVTPEPPVEDRSRIGSTDSIFVMGIVIVALTSLPVLLRRKKK